MASAQEHGKLRLRATNAEETLSKILWEGTTYDFRVENIGGTEYPGSYDPQKQPHLLAQKYNLLPDDKLYLEFKADAADTIESEESWILVPVRMADMSSGAVKVTYLKGEDFKDASGNDFGRSSNTDISCAAGDWQAIGYYTVPKQQILRVGNNIPANGRLYIYLGDDS